MIGFIVVVILVVNFLMIATIMKKKHYLATPEFWQELIRTRKALEIARYAIKNIKDDMKKVKDGDDIWEIQKNLHDYCKTTLKQIKAQEQKEEK